MAYIVGPDLTDSDLSDEDYFDYLPKPSKEKYVPRELTPEERKDKQKLDLYNAICSGNIEAVKKILDDGLNVNINLQSNWTPLLLSVSIGNYDLTEELIKRGADPNSSRDGCTALMMACNCPKNTSPYEQSVKIVKLLVEKGAKVDTINRKRMNALMFAANAGNLPAVKYLLPLSDKNAEDNQRWTALFWAVNNNEVEVFKYLLDEGFDTTTADVRGNTPLDIAKNNDFLRIIDLFPNDEYDFNDIINENNLSFKDTFKDGKQPAFFLDICDMLYGMKSEALINTFSNKKVTLKQFLTLTDEELKELGVEMPYQRYRILSGLYKFHKQPFNTNSIHVVPLNDIYSNVDVAIQILSAVKQISVMEASLEYIMKHGDLNTTEEDLVSLKKSITTIRKRKNICGKITRELVEKARLWDKSISPADLITANSRCFKWPWRKIIFTVTIVSVYFAFKI